MSKTLTEVTLMFWDKRGGELGVMTRELGETFSVPEGTAKVEILAITERRSVW